MYRIFFQLMRKDLIQLGRVYRGKFFDTSFLLFIEVSVFGYFTPMMSFAEGYGVFILFGAIASFGLFGVVGPVWELFSDIEGDKKISYTLSMPIPSYAVFGQMALKWAIEIFLSCLPLFALGKLLLWNQMDLAKIDLLRMLLIYLSICLFFGVFGLWLAGVIQNAKSLGGLYIRFITPIFMFGGYFFTWKTAFSMSPVIGYTLLINPMIYVMEGIRSAALGNAGYLPFWSCFFALWAFILVLYFHGISCLKRRLDCI